MNEEQAGNIRAGGERFLVTGAVGCIGSWVVRFLASSGAEVTLFDLNPDDSRLRLMLEPADVDFGRRITGDLTRIDDVLAAAEGVTHIVHLAALQIPHCRANPSMGAAVNVLGTVNVFEAARANGVDNLVYTSSVAVFGHPDNYESNILGDDAERLPNTHYGVYKVTNEDTAAVYWNENQLPSVGLRPHTVFGPGRDQGFTSYPTQALLAAVRGEAFHIPYGGTLGFQYAPDVARILLDCARAAPGGCDVYNIAGSTASVAEFVEAIGEATGSSGITHGDEQIAIPQGLDDPGLRSRLPSVQYTPLAEAVAATAEWFRRAMSEGRPLPPSGLIDIRKA